MKILPHSPIQKPKNQHLKDFFPFCVFGVRRKGLSDCLSPVCQKENTIRTSMFTQFRTNGVITENPYVFSYLLPVNSLTFATSAACPALSPSLPLVFALYL